MSSIKSLKWTALSLVALSFGAGCSSAPQESDETKDELNDRFSSVAYDFHVALDRCKTESDPAFELACLTKAVDEANRAVDDAQHKNYPGIAFADYLSSTIPMHREYVKTLCTALAASDKVKSIDACRAAHERNLADAIIEFAFDGRVEHPASPPTGSKCEVPRDVPAGDADKQDHTFEIYADCIVDEIKARHGEHPSKLASFLNYVCDPIATAAKVGEGKRAISIQSGRCWATSVERLAAALAR